MTTLNLHGNLLDDHFAAELAQVIGQNPILHKIDISKNPIGPKGAKCILDVLIEKNQTLSSLGDLDLNDMMGVRVREELRQALQLNNSSHDKKKAFIEQLTSETRTKFVDDHDLTQGNDKKEKAVSQSKQAAYPLLKPVMFTNQND